MFFVWIDWLKWIGIWILMDGKGWCFDNIFIECFWWFLKYECVYFYVWEIGL